MLDGLKLLVQRLAANHVRPSGSRRTLDDAASHDGQSFDHAEWDALLKCHVRPGHTFASGVVSSCVDYAGLARDPRFESYLSALAAVDLEQLAPAQRLALLLNAYNALCCSLIVSHARQEPDARLASITALSVSGGKSVWDTPAGVLGGRSVSLGEVEHTMLRGAWDEPSLHFCIVCASASCPDLRAEAFVAARLRVQMQEQAAAFSANPTKGVAWDGRTLTLSRILYWFADDFGGPAAAAHFIVDALRASDPELAETIKRVRRSAVFPRTRHFAYDWTLNRVPDVVPDSI